MGVIDQRIRTLLRPHFRRVLGVAGWATLLALLTALYGALVGPLLRALFGGTLAWPALVADLLPPPPRAEVLRIWLPGLLVAAALLKGIAQHRHATRATALGQAVLLDLRLRLHRRILGLPPDAVARFGLGALQSRALHDLQAVERWAVEGTASRLRDGAQVGALLALCLVIEWRLALVVFGTYPLAFWPIARVGRRLRRAAGATQASQAALTTELDDQLRRLSLIQLSGATAAADARFFARGRDTLAAALDQVRIRALAPLLNEAVGALALAATLVYAGQRITAGTLAAEHVLSFFVAVLLLYQPVKGLVRSQAVIEPGRAALERLEEVLSLPDHLPTGGAAAPPSAPPEIVFEGVGLIRGGRPVLRGLDLRLPAGALTAISGPNGAGKTTLAWVIARLVEPDAGRVSVDGAPLEALDASAWRRAIGWVTQQPLLGRGTIEENLCFGGATLSAEAIELAGLVPVLARLPAGLQTPLGDDGAGLSGGEQQRLALARALARKPALLILDEPTAHLDPPARAALMTSLRALRGRMTLLLITHDPALAAQADHHHALIDGRIA